MITCLIVAGGLWITDGVYVFSVDSIRKDPQSANVIVRPTNRQSYRTYSISEQRQYYMGTEEYLSDCVRSGYEIAAPVDIGGEAEQFVPWDDIDVNERTGIDD